MRGQDLGVRVLGVGLEFRVIAVEPGGVLLGWSGRRSCKDKSSDDVRKDDEDGGGHLPRTS